IYLIENEKRRLLIIGDLIVIEFVQFPVPDITAIYDKEQKDAAHTRRQVLNYAAKYKIPVAGMHILYPGMGKVNRVKGGDGFKFTPSSPQWVGV
ncbi:MAG: hypothetical protein LBC76_12060, partial [Treponema sp.]|nr:hypothetical protein [Treponema sp.]